MNMNILAVDIKHMSVYDFLKDGETEEELKNRAETNQQEDINSWDSNRKQYPCESYENYYKEAIARDYRVMGWDEFENMKKDFYLSGEPTEITEDQFNDALNVLPPLKWCTIDGTEEFLMCEFYTGSFTSQYARKGDRYFTKMVDAHDKTTWLHNII